MRFSSEKSWVIVIDYKRALAGTAPPRDSEVAVASDPSAFPALLADSFRQIEKNWQKMPKKPR